VQVDPLAPRRLGANLKGKVERVAIGLPEFEASPNPSRGKSIHRCLRPEGRPRIRRKMDAKRLQKDGDMTLLSITAEGLISDFQMLDKANLIENPLPAVTTCCVSVRAESIAPVSVWRTPTAEMPGGAGVTGQLGSFPLP